MKDFSLGKIYRIVDNTNDKCYIGSTCEPTLARRLAKHRHNYRDYVNGKGNYISSFEVLKNGDYEIVLIESYPCNSKDELFARERFYCQTMDCVNKNKNQGLIKELGQIEYDKQKHKKHYELNSDKIKEKVKKYAQENPEKIKTRSKTYRENNKEAIAEKKKQVFTCECGTLSTIVHKVRHCKSKKHQDYLKTVTLTNAT